MKALPENPNLDHLKKQAKTLRTLHRNEAPEAAKRISNFDTHYSQKSYQEIFDSKFSINDAQKIIARQRGFPSWAKLKRFVETTGRKFNQEINKKLIKLIKEEETLFSGLVKNQKTETIYHPKMQAIHISNAKILEQIIEQHGWPGTSMVGVLGCRAAWQIAQHAINTPTFQRKCLALMTQAALNDEIPFRQVALITDRILFNENKPQLYGLISDWDEQGKLIVPMLDDKDEVNKRRAEIGLLPFDEDMEIENKKLASNPIKAPQNWQRYKQQGQEWAEKVGWR